MASLVASRSMRSVARRFAGIRSSPLQRAWLSSYPPHEIVGLPTLSPTMDSGSIANWTLNEGDPFAPGDIFCSVETDKATVDFEAQEEGYLAKILAQAGSGDIKVGDPIMIIVEEKESVAAFQDYQLTHAPSSTEPAAPPKPAPTAAAPLTASSTTPAAATTTTTTTTTTSSTAPAATSGHQVFASPLARILAKEMGYDISKIKGTGPDGRVLAADVKEYTPLHETAPAQEAIASAAPNAAPVPGAGYTDYPLTQSARETAARLQQAKRNVPHYYLTVDISVDQLLKLRSTLNDTLEKPLGVYELLIKAAAMSMKAVPSVNASWMDSVVRVYDKVDINVVVGTGDQLISPVIRDVTGKGLKSISSELNDVVDSLGSEDTVSVDGGMGTFTMVNLGMYGVKSCAPIIREPQACALAIGALENRIVPNDNPDSQEIYKESVVMTATLSCDHRVVDGAVGAQWLSAFKTHIENPSTLLL